MLTEVWPEMRTIAGNEWLDDHQHQGVHERWLGNIDIARIKALVRPSRMLREKAAK